MQPTTTTTSRQQPTSYLERISEQIFAACVHQIAILSMTLGLWQIFRNRNIRKGGEKEEKRMNGQFGGSGGGRGGGDRCW